ncbi:tRNA adenosine(34) deaminase TadA [Cellulosilyticum sp. I15G10I2]|uniref:tRNA adenosine(34) deaminase TadA n=1 Tax=Cellulosilyticum sp. I15G10I2 TaxID=1892843 RepID=UPI00085CD03B|nr:tRNA adenosine(34) deaminase TadA [Cellulosilyticum sp. I15G10I2]
MNEDLLFMQEALLEARKAYELDETPIGAVVVYQGKIIGRGYNRRNTEKNALAHAEMIAINEACSVIGDWRLEECTMYITLEPCPMCAGAIVQARVQRVVFGTRSPKAGCAGSVINILQMSELNHQCEIIEDVCKEDCSMLIKNYFRQMRNKNNIL